MKNILKLALVAVALLVFSCGKNNDDTQTENTRIVGTWKLVKTEEVKDGKRVNSREIKDDGCSKYVFGDKELTHYYPKGEDKECISEKKLYRIENGKTYYIFIEDDNMERSFGFRFIDNDTFEKFGENGITETYKRVK